MVHGARKVLLVLSRLFGRYDDIATKLFVCREIRVHPGDVVANAAEQQSSRLLIIFGGLSEELEMRPVDDGHRRSCLDAILSRTCPALGDGHPRCG